MHTSFHNTKPAFLRSVSLLVIRPPGHRLKLPAQFPFKDAPCLVGSQTHITPARLPVRFVPVVVVPDSVTTYFTTTYDTPQFRTGQLDLTSLYPTIALTQRSHRTSLNMSTNRAVLQSSKRQGIDPIPPLHSGQNHTNILRPRRPRYKCYNSPV